MLFEIIIIMCASFLYGIVYHLDKFMINGIDESEKSIKTSIIFSSLVAGLVFTPIWLIISNFSIATNPISLIFALLSSLVYILSTYFYFKALDKNEVSIIVVMMRMKPVFSYFLALIFFKEMLTIQQILGSIIIIISAILISVNLKERNKIIKYKALIFSTISSILFAMHFILLDISIRHDSYNSCAFWFQIGLLIIGIIIIFFKNNRTTFVNAIKKNGKKYLSLNIIAEILNLIAVLLINFANVTIPIALVDAVEGFQCIFVFLFEILGVKFLSQYFHESINKKVRLQKFGCIILSFIGLFIICINS